MPHKLDVGVSVVGLAQLFFEYASAAHDEGMVWQLSRHSKRHTDPLFFGESASVEPAIAGLCRRFDLTGIKEVRQVQDPALGHSEPHQGLGEEC